MEHIRIKELREQMNLSRADFATRAGIPQSSLSLYERDEAQPSTEVLIRIARTFHVSLDWLCGVDRPVNTPLSFVQALFSLLESQYVSFSPDDQHDQFFYHFRLSLYGSSTMEERDIMSDAVEQYMEYSKELENIGNQKIKDQVYNAWKEQLFNDIIKGMHNE